MFVTLITTQAADLFYELVHYWQVSAILKNIFSLWKKLMLVLYWYYHVNDQVYVRGIACSNWGFFFFLYFRKSFKALL